jgi:hypothetical protein
VVVGNHNADGMNALLHIWFFVGPAYICAIYARPIEAWAI